VYLKEITGLQGVSLQPAAGSQGEFTGIMMFRAYHLDRGDVNRDKILIPDSAHGTNPASSSMAGFQIISIKSNEYGRIDIDDLRNKAGDDVAGLMLTNPNTLGIFESDIVEIEKIVHGCGGLMYMDGANLNALLGIVRPGDMKFDCVHINLHKTFSTPHGGGGPGSGPVCVSEKLIPYLPIPRIIKTDNSDVQFTFDFNQPKSIGKVHSYYGNFGMFIRAYTYIRMYGKEKIRTISENAILNANYLLWRLKEHYHVPFADNCMHEFVISGNLQKKDGVTTKDIAKKLLDYGFHAPTIYFPLIVHESMLLNRQKLKQKKALMHLPMQ
jgi:glycine dehydrogenase subunit 2